MALPDLGGNLLPWPWVVSPHEKRLRRARLQLESEVDQLENAVEKEKIVLTPDVQGRHAREGDEEESQRERGTEIRPFLELVFKQNDTSQTPRIAAAAGGPWGEQPTRTREHYQSYRRLPGLDLRV